LPDVEAEVALQAAEELQDLKQFAVDVVSEQQRRQRMQYFRSKKKNIDRRLRR
jgi:hypothetical protein